MSTAWWVVIPNAGTDQVAMLLPAARAQALAAAAQDSVTIITNLGSFRTQAAANAAIRANGGTPGPTGGGGNPAPSGGQWYIEYVVAGGGSGGAAVPTVIQSASQPQSGGDIQWVYGPYPSKAAAQADLNSGPSSGKLLNSRGLTDNSSAKPGQSLSSSILGPFEEAATWERVAIGLLGIVLIAIGVARLTHAVPAATDIAKTAGAVAI